MSDPTHVPVGLATPCLAARLLDQPNEEVSQ
jgi:hypothetical protein